ncbi:hypothetical protein E2C01_017372 [Portunus trituberculatus]|uniref:Uncharacterized protein n=1 Tax=Portunus trituberculatus TaxID=210409 RepID=A0A5B7DRG7_PORTR|nr:hypothetical protein [Portunus trituberculatus]
MASTYWSSVVNMPIWPLGSQGGQGERGITVLGSLSQHSTPLSLHISQHHPLTTHHTTLPRRNNSLKVHVLAGLEVKAKEQ